MNDKALKMPFSTFDFFGYVIPGTMLLLGLYVHDRVLLNGMGPFLKICSAIISKPKQLLNPYLFPLVLFVGMIVAYIMGHIVSAIGSALLDRMIIDRVNFYPYVKLLNSLFKIEPKEMFKRRCSKMILLVLLTLNVLMAIWGPSKLVLCVLIFGFFLLLFKLLVDNMFRKHGEPQFISLDDSLKERWRCLNCFEWRVRIWKAIFFILNEVVIVGEKACRLTFGTVLSLLRIGHAFPKPFQHLFKEKFERVYGRDPNGFETNVFWLAVTYIVQHLPSNAALAQRAYNFYTLNRNLSITFFLLLWYGIVVHFYWLGNLAIKLSEEQVENMYYIWWIILTAAFTVILVLRYYNTYYNHYTKLVLRSFVTPEKSSDNANV